MGDEEIIRALREAADSIYVPPALGVILARIAARCPMCDGQGRRGGCLLCTIDVSNGT